MSNPQGPGKRKDAKAKARQPYEGAAASAPGRSEHHGHQQSGQSARSHGEAHMPQRSGSSHSSQSHSSQSRSSESEMEDE